jgi:hypothetical protein
MPVKKPNDAWPVAPEAPAYKPESSEGTSAITIQKILAVIPIVGVAVVIFGALAQPHLHRTTTGQPDTAAVSTAATTLPGNAPMPARAGETPQVVPEITPSVQPDARMSTAAPIIQAASPTPASLSPDVTAAIPAQTAAQPSVSAVGASLAAPAPLPTATTPAPLAPPATATPGETGIRSTSVVIAGHIYECYGQQAHLACDLKQ